MMLGDLWTQLDSYLHLVKFLEAVTTDEDKDEKNGGNEYDNDGPSEKVLQSSVGRVLTCFLPIIEDQYVYGKSFATENKDRAMKRWSTS